MNTAVSRRGLLDAAALALPSMMLGTATLAAPIAASSAPDVAGDVQLLDWAAELSALNLSVDAATEPFMTLRPSDPAYADPHTGLEATLGRLRERIDRINELQRLVALSDATTVRGIRAKASHLHRWLDLAIGGGPGDHAGIERWNAFTLARSVLAVCPHA